MVVVNGRLGAVAALDPETIDFPTLAFLAGSVANEYLLERLRAGGHPAVRNAHGYVFQCLIDGPKSVGELAGLLGVTQQAASKTLLELESLGYVERSVDESDSRVRRVALSARGRSLVQRARAARSALEAELRARLGARAISAARRSLLALLEHSGGLDSVRARRVKAPSR